MTDETSQTRDAPKSCEVDVSAFSGEARRSVQSLIEENETLRSQLARATERIEQVESDARRDPLTGLGNRRAFDEEIGRATDMVRRYSVPISVLFVDLDRFKQVNDDYGHTVGDRALCHVAAQLNANVRKSDMVARLGGDEFALVLFQSDLATARLKAQALTSVIAGQPLSIEGAQLDLGASIGAAEILPEDADGEAVLARADRAMYAIKTARRHKAARTQWRP